jgi:hypothetical protein
VEEEKELDSCCPPGRELKREAEGLKMEASGFW